MTTTTPQMLLVMPDDHGNINAWGLLLNTIFERLDIHTHVAGLGVQVPSAGLNINADLALGTNALTGAKAFDMTPVATSAVTAYSSALFTNSADNNLYFRNSSGTNVQITAGSTINVSVVGGIGGDYASIGALLDYDDATDTYRLRQETSALVRQFARASVGGVRLFEYKAAGDPSVPTQSVLLASPAALGAGYTVTWPGAVPASTSIVQMSSAGTLTASPTGTVACGTITVAANSHVVVSGTGEFKHGDRWIQVVPVGFDTPSLQEIGAAGGAITPLASAAARMRVSIPLHRGDRVLEVTARVQRGGGGTVTCTFFRWNSATATTLATLTDNSGGSFGTLSSTAAPLPVTLVAEDSIIVQIDMDNLNNRVSTLSVRYDHP